MHLSKHLLAGAALSIALAGPAAAEPIWSYDESAANGPSQWGTLADEYQACSNGLSQSPIDLAAARPGAGPALVFNYRSTELVIENNARTVEVVYEPGSTLRVGADTYRLLQFHFHTPSEHRINGAEFPLETHFVHINTAGQLAVVGVFARLGRANAALEQILANAPEDEGEVHVEERLNGTSLMPRHRGYRTYPGSLTTPPCSEGVRWFVLRESIEVSAEQVERLQQILEHVQHLPFNARPVQPSNDRRLIDRRGR